MALRLPKRRALVGVLIVIALLPVVYGLAVWTRVDSYSDALPGSGGKGTTWLFIGSDSRAAVPSGDTAAHCSQRSQRELALQKGNERRAVWRRDAAGHVGFARGSSREDSRMDFGRRTQQLTVSKDSICPCVPSLCPALFSLHASSAASLSTAS